MEPQNQPTAPARPVVVTDAQKVIIALLAVLVALGGFLAYRAAQPAAATDCTTQHIDGGAIQRDSTHCS